MNQPHALQQAADRITKAGLDPMKVYNKAQTIAAALRGQSAAVLMATLPEDFGDTTTDVMSRASNGNEVWAVLRDGRVVTIMLRRDSQPKRPEAFNVDRVLRVTP